MGRARCGDRAAPDPRSLASSTHMGKNPLPRNTAMSPAASLDRKPKAPDRSKKRFSPATAPATVASRLVERPRNQVFWPSVENRSTVMDLKLGPLPVHSITACTVSSPSSMQT